MLGSSIPVENLISLMFDPHLTEILKFLSE